MNKFITESGIEFYYDSSNNSMYNNKKELISAPQDPGIDYKDLAKNHNTIIKTRNPVALRILFGHACNYSCSYCMQKDIGNPNERAKSIHIDSFINNVKLLNLDNLERVELWGGEPFLYWNDIKEVMTQLDKEGLHFFISTNGSPLRQKHIDFFKTLKATIALGISHDGPGQEALRGEEILNKPHIQKVLKQLDNLYPKVQFSFNTVISNTNWNLFKINAFFYKFVRELGLKNTTLSFTLGRSYDKTDSKNSFDCVVEDLQGFEELCNDYIDKCIRQLKEEGLSKSLPILQSNIFNGSAGSIKYAQLMRSIIPITMTSNCGADAKDVLSLDTQGNIRLCPHTEYISGNITSLNSFEVGGMDLTKKISHCGNCSVKRLCKSSCPINFPSKTFLKNCRAEKIWYGAIQLGAFALLFGERCYKAPLPQSH